MNKINVEEEHEKKWYEEFPKDLYPSKCNLSEIEILQLKDEAKQYLSNETAAFQLKQSKIRDSDMEWRRTALLKGTNADKIAAAILMIQDNPKYNLSRLVNLVSQVKGSKHTQSNLLLISLRGLFLSDLLHPQCKLLKFEEQDFDKIKASNDSENINGNALRKKLLSHWYFEDQLREQYEKFILALSSLASDTVEINRERVVAIMTELLIGNSEQEHKLLELIVNKIGDPSSKVASKTIFCLNKLLKTHPNMKLVVLKEIEKLLFRPNIAQRAQYYGICLLTQFILSPRDEDIATHSIDVYFAFFKACLKKGEPDSRMMAAILTGVNRAYRFSNMDAAKLNDHIDSVYKVVHVGSFNVSLSALSLLQQVSNKNPLQENRFYTTFYRKLLDPQIGTANKRAVFLNLLYRIMKNDKNVFRLYAFFKRVLQISCYFPVCMVCATLYVISQILKIRKDLQELIFRNFAELKSEQNTAKETSHDQSVIEESINDHNDSSDVKILDDESNTLSLPNVIMNPSTESSIKDTIKIEEDNAIIYDPFCLNPLKSGASKSPLVELTALIEHFHPSVSLFAKNIICNQVINYTGDPLQDLTLIRFLDRFVFKNPKKITGKKFDRHNPLAARAKYIPRGLRSLAVDSQAYLNENENNIPIDELFLHRYLRKRNEKKMNVKTEEDDSDHESVNSEEFNELMDGLSRSKDFDDLDFAGEFQLSKKKNKSTKVNENEEEIDFDNNDEDFDEDDNDELMEDEDGLDLDDMDDEDMSEIEFDESDEDEEMLKKSVKSVLGKKSSKKPKIDSNVFVSADEFAELLEKQGQSKFKIGGSNVFSDADGANVKQLDWEMKRDEKITGKYKRKKNFKNTKQEFKINKKIKKNKKFY
ncbi:CCAAT/enhancer-binding protein zeta [Chelonus insularis]|uniref:CCAAT/enhancer-binding protein zeta n=1 Tax=Chelonus insularis TaxID=460826 RepID=UPI00158E3C23|nr:CCAAT/enhancer-binding protein zeta [Chelonus insularis]